MLKISLKSLYTLSVILLISACSSFQDAGKVLRNEKIKTTDEFLVKKRNPLVLPPNYEEMPKPGSINKKEESQKEKIKKILKVQEEENNNSKSTSAEESILKKIRKWKIKT